MFCLCSNIILTYDYLSHTKVDALKHRLTRLKEVMSDIHPDCLDLIPHESGVDLQKLGQGGQVMTDTCSTAQKLRRILVEQIPGAYDYDCMNHNRNVWFKAMEAALTEKLNGILKSDLEEIDPRLRVTASISAIIRAIDKEFSLSANYPKGHGELFLEWIRKHHPGELLMHIERASGSRQDLCTEGCLPILMNYPYYLEFLDEALRKREKNKQASILQRNLFIALGSSEMIALVRLLSIIHLSITIPMRWLAGKTQDLKQYTWGPMSMGRALDTLEMKLEELMSDPSLILKDNFMMSMFDEFADELPPLREYFEHLYEKKRMSVISRKSGTKVVHLGRMRRELFAPSRKTERDTNKRVQELAKVAANSILTELRDESKATHKYLSRFGKEYSWKHCPEIRKQALLGCTATNDECESSLGGTTSQIQRYGRLHISRAGGVSDIKRNAFLYRSSKSRKDSRGTGLFHQFPDELREAIVLVGMRDAKAQKANVNEALRLQAEARRLKEEKAKEKNMEKVTEEYIEAANLIDLYNSDKAIKGDPKQVSAVLKTLGSETAKLNALKLNIKMRFEGFGWEWSHHPWSKDGRRYSVNELAKHLRWVIKKEIKDDIEIPSEPRPKIPQRTKLGVLGTPTDFVKTLDAKYLSNEGEFKRKAERIRQQREINETGKTSIYARMQPFTRPALADLVGRRIDVNYKLSVHGEPVFRWCQGEVLEVCEERTKPTVLVLWDAAPDIAGSEEAMETEQILMPGKWNGNVDGAWRLDFNIAIGDDEDDDNVMAEDDDSNLDAIDSDDEMSS